MFYSLNGGFGVGRVLTTADKVLALLLRIKEMFLILKHQR